MFKLVGDDVFHLESVRCVIRVDPAPGFKYSYALFVDGKPFQQFKERQAKVLKTWEAIVDEKHVRVVLGERRPGNRFNRSENQCNFFPFFFFSEKETLNIFMNGVLREEDGEFVDDGTETRWQDEDGNEFVLNARTSGNKRDGLIHSLTVNGQAVDEMPISE